MIDSGLRSDELIHIGLDVAKGLQYLSENKVIYENS